MQILEEPAKIFYCYAREDEKMRNKLAQHLEPLRAANKIITWYDRKISPGTEYRQEIFAHIDTSDIILALISPAFVASNYCQDTEIHRALQKHLIGSTRIIPIIVKDVEWQHTTLGGLQALPTNAKPLNRWQPIDKGFRDVVLGIEKVVKEIYRSIAPHSKENSLLFSEKGFMLYENGFYDEAILAFKTALKYDNDLISIWMCLVDCLIAVYRTQDALLTCNHFISQYPQKRDSFFALEDILDIRQEVEDYEFFYQTKYTLLKQRASIHELKQFRKDYQFILNDMQICFPKKDL